MNIFGRKKTVLLIVLLFLILVSLLLVYYRESNTPQEVKQKAKEPELLFSINPPVLKYYDPYTKTRIGDNIKDVLDKLTPPKKTNPLPNNTIQYFFDSGYPLRDDEITAKNDIIVFKKLVVLNEQAISMPKLDSYTKIYGKPEAEHQGSKAYGRFMKTYVYGSLGFALVFNPSTEEIFEIQTFEPTTAANYLKTWGEDIKVFSDEPVGP